jgi:hypothetical protein
MFQERPVRCTLYNVELGTKYEKKLRGGKRGWKTTETTEGMDRKTGNSAKRETAVQTPANGQTAGTIHS